MQTSAARGELPLDKVSPLAARAAGASAAAPAGGGAPAPAARRTINPAQQLRQQQQALEAAELPGLDAMPAEVHAGSGAALSDGEESGGGDQGGGCHEDDNVSISSSSSSEPGSARGGGDEEENGSEALTEGMTEDMTDDVLELAPDEGPSQVPDTQPPATEVSFSFTHARRGPAQPAAHHGFDLLAPSACLLANVAALRQHCHVLDLLRE